MQNKGFVKVIAVALTLVCLFYLSFSAVTHHYENKAAAMGEAGPAYLDSLKNERVWLGVYTLKDCQELQISLGLDTRSRVDSRSVRFPTSSVRWLATTLPTPTSRKPWLKRRRKPRRVRATSSTSSSSTISRSVAATIWAALCHEAEEQQHHSGQHRRGSTESPDRGSPRPPWATRTRCFARVSTASVWLNPTFRRSKARASWAKSWSRCPESRNRSACVSCFREALTSSFGKR